jgi:hypothetical protein
MIVLLDPLVDTKFGPHKAQTDTAIHIAVIAREAQTSLRSRTEVQLP